jgi:regulatory protein
LQWLARREHSSFELLDKLAKKGCAPELAAQVVERLKSERLLSDERFVESLIAARQRRGCGPLRVQRDLAAKGIPEEMIERWLDPRAREWTELLHEVRRKKFGANAPKSFSERAKQGRFLQYRGFGFEQIQQMFNSRDTD